MTERQLDAFVKRLTLKEKASLMSGRDFWQTKPLPDKGVWPLRLSDGPHGLRKEDLKNAKENGGHSVKATCFPTAAALACSWDEELAEQVGAATVSYTHLDVYKRQVIHGIGQGVILFVHQLADGGLGGLLHAFFVHSVR